RIRSLAARALEHPRLQVVPAEVPPGGTLAPLLAAEATARARAAGLWAHEREAILERLTGEALSQSTHRRHRIRDVWAAKIAATFAVDRPGAVHRCKELEKLTSTAIIGATKKDETPPMHPFF